MSLASKYFEEHRMKQRTQQINYQDNHMYFPFHQIYYPQLIKMQFSQINKYQSLIQRHLKPSFEPFHALSYDYELNPKESIRQVLSDLEEINMARSYSLTHINVEDNHKKSSKQKSNQSSEETLSFEQSRTFASERILHKNSKNKSLIFGQHHSQKERQKHHTSQHKIKVYYFNLPIFKTISFNSTTTVIDLINNALDAYQQDDRLDSNRIKNKHYQNYEMRLVLNDNTHKADMNITPISYDRLINDNIFEELVILHKQKTERGSFFKAQPIEFIKSPKKSTILINLFNELNEQLGCLTMNKSDSLQKIFEYIQTNDLHNMRNFYITESTQDDDGLPRDFQIRNLQSNKIYIKAKKYIDETEFQAKQMKPIRNLTIFKKERESSINLPIGLNEASQYQQFFVIKVNNMGFEQERILGIDQSKIYNYDKNIRQEKKEAGFFSKIFGVNQETGTKRPFRLIADVLSISPVDKGLIIAFKEKSIKYIIRNPDSKQKIYRKLSFLVNYIKGEKNNTDKSSKK